MNPPPKKNEDQPYHDWRKIVPGAVLREDDMYLSTTGKFEPCPCPGLPLGEGLAVTWWRWTDLSDQEVEQN